jgi:hypothetical protein
MGDRRKHACRPVGRDQRSTGRSRLRPASNLLGKRVGERPMPRSLSKGVLKLMLCQRTRPYETFE